MRSAFGKATGCQLSGRNGLHASGWHWPAPCYHASREIASIATVHVPIGAAMGWLVAFIVFLHHSKVVNASLNFCLANTSASDNCGDGNNR
jgi:hypothetical protein